MLFYSKATFMPTIKALSTKQRRVSFFSFDCAEPIHVHIVEQGKYGMKKAKIWVRHPHYTTVTESYNHGFTKREINAIKKEIADHQDLIITAWNEHCGTDGGTDEGANTTNDRNAVW